MRRIALLLMMTAAALALVPVTAATAATGMTVTARWAMLGDDPTAVVLVGRYTCGPFPGGAPDRGVIDMGVNQVVNGVEVRGIGYLTPTVCDGQPQWYAVELTTFGGLTFRRANATWGASGYVEGGGGMQNVHVPPAAIRIR